MVYKNTNKVEITKKELENLNKLFEIDFENVDDNGEFVQQELIDELGACRDDCFGVACFEFENGAKVSINIASGNSNYFDSIWFELEDEEFVFDCGYSFEEIMEFENENDTYICEFTIVEKGV